MSARISGRPDARWALLALAFTLATIILPASPALAATPYRGVNVHSLWYDRPANDMARELSLARDVNANVVRVDVGWATLQPRAKGQFSADYVNRLDAFFAEARSRDLKVIVTLWQTPCWASTAPESLKRGCADGWWDRGVTQYPPLDPRTYGDAARWITTRYGASLAALEVWNEPNLNPRFWVSADAPRDYARLLKAAYAGVRSGRSGVPVLAGALAAADRDWLAALYGHGIRGNFDGISVHPYNEWRHPDDRWKEEWRQYTFLPGIESIREMQIRHGDDKPLWVTEFGWTTDTASRWGVTEADQADYLVRAFGILDGLSYVRAAVSYELRDGGTDPSDLEDNFGLVRWDFSPKPAYAAVQAALAPTDSVRLLAAAAEPPTGSAPATAAEPPVAEPAAPSPGVGPRTVTTRVVTRKVGRSLVAFGRAAIGSRVRVIARHRGRRSDKAPIVRFARADGQGRFQRRIGPRTLRVVVRAHALG